jgi:hypothetical protein
VIQAALTIIARGRLDNIQFKYKDEILVPNDYGALHNWPKGFADLDGYLMSERLGIQVKRNRAERAEREEKRKNG